MKLAFTFVALGVSMTAAGFARAQAADYETTYLTAEKPPGALRAPTRAVELTVGTGYTQGFGNFQSGVGMPSVASPGVSLDLGVGYRLNPKWAVLWSGQYAELTSERADAARAFTGTIAAQYHFAPAQRVDPWFEFGAGYKFFFEDPATGPNFLTHGLQLGRLRAGIDFRAAEAVSLGPVIGGDATYFLFQDVPGAGTNIPDPTVSTFVFAGLQGRFDIPTETRTTSATAKR